MEKETEKPKEEDICAVCGCSFKKNPVPDIAVTAKETFSNSFTNYNLLASHESRLVCLPCYNMLFKKFIGKAMAITPNQYTPLSLAKDPKKENGVFKILELIVNPPEFPIVIIVPKVGCMKHVLLNAHINYSNPIMVSTDSGNIFIPSNFSELYDLASQIPLSDASYKNILKYGKDTNSTLEEKTAKEISLELNKYKDTLLLPLLISLTPKRVKAKKSKNIRK